jgi:hypothetical protein
MLEIIRILTNVFIILSLFWMWSWDLPNKYFRKLLANKIARVARFSGLTHSWNMFSPNPPLAIHFITIIVHTKEGITREWATHNNPEMRRFSLRIRSIKIDHMVANDRQGKVRLRVAQYHARQCAKSGLTPVSFVVRIHSVPIRLPGEPLAEEQIVDVLRRNCSASL